jgi:flagellar motility protein MotE (MotC chaperone)
MQYERRNYPGKAILQVGEKLYKEILDIKDNKAFFDNLNDNKEELLDFEEDSHDVRKFFLNQRNVYDKAADTAEIYRKNSAYITDTETVETANEIIRILSLKSPYSEIKDLPELTDRFQTLYVNILETECAPIEATIKSDRDFVKSYYTEKGVNEIASKVQTAFEELLRRLSETQNVFEAIAMNTESDRIKMRFIKEIDETYAAKSATETQEAEPANTPKPRLKTISVKTLFTGSNSVKSADDVDRLMKKVGDKLKSQLEENTTLNII